MILLRKIMILIALISASSVRTEIEQVVVRWRGISCGEPCAEQLEKELLKMRGADEVSVSAPGQQAVIRWKENTRFSFSPINTAFRIVGPSIWETRISVKGKVRVRGDHAALISSGDRTRFVLLNPIIPKAGEYIEESNPEARGLSNDLLTRLIEAEDKDWTVSIEGPLFYPTRGPPLSIVIARLDVQKEKPQNTRQYRGR